ncbi:MAG: hypothetical protein LLG16_03900, partial [Euryarchaeota archaeon]|nr:hypothetical protein [Euryarchaeota archaeon]
MPSKVLTHRVVGKQYRDQESVLVEFWKQMSVTMRVKSPQELIAIDSVVQDAYGGGWVVKYVADVEDSPAKTEPNAAIPYKYVPPKLSEDQTTNAAKIPAVVHDLPKNQSKLNSAN